MNRSLTALLLAAALSLLISCSSTDQASGLIMPDRNQEGFSGPGIRLSGNEMNTNRLDHLTQTEYAPRDYLRRQQEEPVDGIDIFQYKKKF